MQLDSHLPVRLLDLVLSGLGGDSEDIIIRSLLGVLIGTRSTASGNARSVLPRTAVLAAPSIRLGFPSENVLAPNASNVELSFVRVWSFEIELGRTARTDRRRASQP